MSDIGAYPFIPAKYFTPLTSARHVRVVVIHDAEYPEKPRAARGVAAYFQNPGLNPDGTPKKPSAHLVVGDAEIIQCVHDNDVANAAPGCNSDGLQIELAGYGNQTAAQWADPYSLAMLDRAAGAVAAYCTAYSLPVRQLTNAELLAGAQGIVGHYQVSQVYHKSDHTDPGPAFPWQEFIAAVAAKAQA